MGKTTFAFLLVLFVLFVQYNDEIPGVYHRLFGSPHPGFTKGAVLLTGAGKGIGKVAALYLDSKGFKVYAGVRNQQHADDLKKAGSSLLTPVILDVTNEEHYQNVYNIIQENSKKYPLIALVHNAAILKPAPFEFSSDDDIKAIYNTNLIAPAMLTRKFLPVIRPNKGRIVFVSSLSEEIPSPFLGVYPSSKKGLSSFAENLHLELLPYGVFVSVVEPGVVMTDMFKTIVDVPWLDLIEPAKRDEAKRVYGEYYSEKNEQYRREVLYVDPQSTDGTNAAIYHAISSPSPKCEYLLGTSGIILKFIRLLPQWVTNFYMAQVIWPGPHVDPQVLAGLN